MAGVGVIHSLLGSLSKDLSSSVNSISFLCLVLVSAQKAATPSWLGSQAVPAGERSLQMQQNCLRLDCF